MWSGQRRPAFLELLDSVMVIRFVPEGKATDDNRSHSSNPQRNMPPPDGRYEESAQACPGEKRCHGDRQATQHLSRFPSTILGFSELVHEVSTAVDLADRLSLDVPVQPLQRTDADIWSQLFGDAFTDIDMKIVTADSLRYLREQLVLPPVGRAAVILGVLTPKTQMPIVTLRSFGQFDENELRYGHEGRKPDVGSGETHQFHRHMAAPSGVDEVPRAVNHQAKPSVGAPPLNFGSKIRWNTELLVGSTQQNLVRLEVDGLAGAEFHFLPPAAWRQFLELLVSEVEHGAAPEAPAGRTRHLASFPEVSVKPKIYGARLHLRVGVEPVSG
ncbi:hypothetical protein JHY03_25050 [Streptomyces sp. CA-256286]|nr:hypothetical protein JHY03_25050 [Streptomyces sp. CA-256286]